MFRFEWLPVLFLLPLPVIFHLLKKQHHAAGFAIRLPMFANLNGLTNFTSTHYRLNLKQGLLWLAWGLLLLAAAKPIWIDELVELPIKGRDIILNIDLSGSMAARDFVLDGRRVDRLTGVKKTALDFVDRRKNDRIGLVVFGTKAFLYSPLTFDKNIVKSYLRQAQIKMAGEKTAIGDSIITAIEHFQDNEQQGNPRALILLTDGENTAGSISVEQATQIAKEQNIKIYTIGLDAGRSIFGRGVDEAALKYIAEQTGGLYFRAQNANALAKIYTKVDALEQNATEKITYQVHEDLFFYPLSVFLLLLIVLMLRRQS